MAGDDLEFTKAPAENVQVWNSLLRWSTIAAVFIGIALLIMAATLTNA